MAAMPEAYDLTCVIHLHSTHSDGTGTVGQIARAAARAGVDVVLLTDHDTLAGEEGWYGQVLVLVGEEVTPRNRDHYLAFDIEERISPRLSGPEICEAVQAQGGFGFAAHPWSRGNTRFKRGGYPWGDFTCLEGVELWSFLNDTGEKLSGFTDIARMIFAPQSIIGGPPEHNLRAWDRMCQARRVVAIGGLDAHQFGIRLAGHVPIRLMGYKRSFKQLHTHVLLDGALTHALQTDRARVYDALREGRCYIANDQVADARGFDFWADDIPMGGEGDASTLHVRAPREARIRLLRDGEIELEVLGRELDHSIELGGVYRVELSLGQRPWIYSNPVYLRTYS